MKAATFSGTRFPGWFFLIQALGIGGWWIALACFPDARQAFLPAGAAAVDLVAFRAPDLIVAVPASFAAGVTFFRRSNWAVPLAWFAAGAVDYALFYCVSWSWLRGGGWTSVVFMAPAGLLSTVAALDEGFGRLSIFRRAHVSSPARHVAATLGQIVVFWSFFLALVPMAIAFVEAQLGWPGFCFPGRSGVGAVLFLFWSALGLASGVTMAARGVGTPLPFAAPNRLVVGGPYAYLRNPMVLAGLGQGLSVGLGLGSWAVIAYVLGGGLIWNFLVRPAEERDLLELFGEDYRVYCRRVRCWIPNLHPFRLEDER
ncbi:MAG: isoprenylcysteine carboxylmethyltransferase family protein [Acidobacteriota bacterium]